MSTLTLGLFGIGLDTYWPQFPALKPRLEGYLEHVAVGLSRDNYAIINGGLVDNEEAMERAISRFETASTRWCSTLPPMRLALRSCRWFKN